MNKSNYLNETSITSLDLLKWETKYYDNITSAYWLQKHRHRDITLQILECNDAWDESLRMALSKINCS